MWQAAVIRSSAKSAATALATRAGLLPAGTRLTKDWRAMERIDVATLEHASRSVMAYVPDDRPVRIAKLMTAAVPALGILAACAVMLLAIL